MIFLLLKNRRNSPDRENFPGWVEKNVCACPTGQGDRHGRLAVAKGATEYAVATVKTVQKLFPATL